MNKEEYDNLYERLEYTKSGALMEDDFELASRIDRAMIAFEAPLDAQIFDEDFIVESMIKGESNKVLRFIKKFQNKDTIKTFTEGCCYWFAVILDKRFNSGFGDNIMIDYVANHFGCKIDNKVYDITGDVTFKYNWDYWRACPDRNLVAQITEHCIYF